MKKFICALAISALCFFCSLGQAAGQTDSRSDYLWFELGPSRYLAGGAMAQTVRLCYGAFPACRRSLSGLEDLALYLADDPQAEAAKRRWRRLPYLLTSEAAEAVVRTPPGNRVALLAQARAGKTRLTARFAFVLFGEGRVEDKAAEAVPRQTDLLLQPAMEFDYWPQTQQRHEIKLQWRGQPWPGPIYICDERFGETRLAADKQGNACHVPARDTWLDRQGETAFKHVVYASARADEEGVQEIATYTRILHRSRSANLRRSAGVALFFGCLLCAWLIAWRWRQEEPT